MQKHLPPHFSDFPAYAVPDLSADLSVRTNGARPARMLCVLADAPEEELAGRLEFLQKVFAATGHALLEDVAVLPLPADRMGKVRFADLRGGGPYERIFVFGLPPKALGLNLRLTPYEPVPWVGTTLLFADATERIAADKVLKAKLWQVLQRLFGLSPAV